MALNSILKPDTSVLLGLANGGVILAIYSGALPEFARIRLSDAHDEDVEATRKQAAWTSAAVLGFMFLLTRDRNSFLIGGLVLAGTDFIVKHANGISPQTKRLDAANGGDIETTAYSLPDYDEGMEDVA
jgi:hypothetical protein